MPNHTRPKTQHKREEIEARNRLDGLVYQMEKTLSENREKVGARPAKSKRIADAKKALEEGGVERMNKAFNALQRFRTRFLKRCIAPALQIRAHLDRMERLPVGAVPSRDRMAM